MPAFAIRPCRTTRRNDPGGLQGFHFPLDGRYAYRESLERMREFVDEVAPWLMEKREEYLRSIGGSGKPGAGQ